MSSHVVIVVPNDDAGDDIMVKSPLQERLSAQERPVVSPILLQERMENAERKRKERLDKLVQREGDRVKRAKMIAAEIKARRTENAKAKQERLDARLDAAAARRASTRAISPLSSPKMPVAADGAPVLHLPPPITLAVPCTEPAAVEAKEDTADSNAGKEATARGTESESTPANAGNEGAERTHQLLLAQLDVATATEDSLGLITWMKEPATVELVATCATLPLASVQPQAAP